MKALELSPWNPAVEKIALNHFLSRKMFRRALPVIETLRRMEPADRYYRDLHREISEELEKETTDTR